MAIHDKGSMCRKRKRKREREDSGDAEKDYHYLIQLNVMNFTKFKEKINKSILFHNKRCIYCKSYLSLFSFGFLIKFLLLIDSVIIQLTLSPFKTLELTFSCVMEHSSFFFDQQTGLTLKMIICRGFMNLLKKSNYQMNIVAIR